MLRREILRIFSARVLARLLAAFSVLAVLRFMRVERFAAYTVYEAVVSVISFTLATAFNRIYILGGERFGLGKDRGSFVAIQLISFSVAGLCVGPFVVGDAVTRIAIPLLALGIGMCEYVKSVLQERREFRLLAGFDVIRSVSVAVALGGLAFGLREGLLPWHILLGHACALLVVACPFLVAQRLLTGVLRLGSALRFCSEVVRTPYRFLLGYFCVLAVFARVDVFLLKLLSSTGETAVFGAAFRYYLLLLVGLQAVNTVLLPTVKHAKTPGEIRSVFAKHLSIGALYVPSVIGFGLLASLWIPIVDGGKYPGSVPVFFILCLSAAAAFLLNPRMSVVLKFERFRFMLLLVIAALGVRIGLSRVLIPRLGAMGAAWSTLIAYLVLNGGVFLRGVALVRSWESGCATRAVSRRGPPGEASGKDGAREL